MTAYIAEGFVIGWLIFALYNLIVAKGKDKNINVTTALFACLITCAIIAVYLPGWISLVPNLPPLTLVITILCWGGIFRTKSTKVRVFLGVFALTLTLVTLIPLFKEFLPLSKWF